ncbi:MAG: hypothetical protein ABNH00_00755 [Dokdonia sp.]|jgi:hypothetical protein
MKKLLVLAVLFLVGTSAQANQVNDLAHGKKKGIRYNQTQAVTFVQKGIQFFVYTNGEFDFRVVGNNAYGRRNARHFNSPGTAFGVTFPNRNNRLVRYDYWGNINKVGRNFILYNRRNMVNQIGNISLRYRKGRLVKVGNMSLFYNRRGHIIDVQGRIHMHRNNRFYAGLTSTPHWDHTLDNWGRRDIIQEKRKIKNRRNSKNTFD